MSTLETQLHAPDIVELSLQCSSSDGLQSEVQGRLESTDNDLIISERENERLVRKLNKRMSGSDFGNPTEYIYDKLTFWHGNKKAEKFNMLFELHLPKLKQIEEKVRENASVVAVSKTTALKYAAIILSLVDKQIDYYQHHMNCLDEVINDIRQCDFNILKEITEMKCTLLFCQVLLPPLVVDLLPLLKV
jgi:hypothetical protein